MCDEKKVKPLSFADIVEYMTCIKIDLHKSHLGQFADLQKTEVHKYKLYTAGYHKICYHHWRP